MKTENSNDNTKFIYNPKPEMLDDFWSDCIEQKEKNKSIIDNKQNNFKTNLKSYYKNMNKNRYIHNQYQPSHDRNTNTQYPKKSNIRTYNSVKLFNPKNNHINSPNNKLNNSAEKYLANIYNRHPSYIEEMKEEEDKKIKRKKALIRCLGLYAYGLELQRTMKMNKENSDKQRIKSDMSQCTFKPKLNKKILYLDDKINYTRGINRLYNPKKFLNKSLDNIYKNTNNNLKNKNNINDDDDLDECTFKPKFESDPKAVEKMFKNKRKLNKTISDEKENAEFILRYTKARDEYLIKRFKKLYRKDDSYDKSLLSITKRLCNREYRNYLNVNNTIHLFGETITPSHNLHSSIAHFKGLSFYNDKNDEKKSKKDNYIEGLRRNLHSLDLNENNEE